MDVPAPSGRSTDEFILEILNPCLHFSVICGGFVENLDTMSGYFSNIKTSVQTLAGGLRLTFRYLFEATTSRKPIGINDPTYFDIDKGIITLQYPHESLPVPENGRYRLHNEMEDCIVCDKCAKICPVDCVEIEPIKDSEVFGTTSDGTPKRIHAAKFDIDMGKCCFCGLCTTVCPTECLTMTKVYDFSEFDVRDHRYSFSEMSLAEIALRRKQQEENDARKAAEKSAAVAAETPKQEGTVTSRPVFRPKVMVKPSVQEAKPAEPKEGENEATKPKPVFQPKPMVKKKSEGDESGA